MVLLFAFFFPFCRNRLALSVALSAVERNSRAIGKKAEDIAAGPDRCGACMGVGVTCSLSFSANLTLQVTTGQGIPTSRTVINDE